jgi:integrase/recombinase XerD
MHREVNLTKRIRTENGLRYCPVVLSANGRAKPDCVLVDGNGERHPEGAYYLEWREHGKRRRLSAGSNTGEAMVQRLKKEAELHAKNHGVAIAPDAESKNGHRMLDAAIVDY